MRRSFLILIKLGFLYTCSITSWASTRLGTIGVDKLINNGHLDSFLPYFSDLNDIESQNHIWAVLYTQAK